MIRELYDHGMSISEISRRLDIDRKTAGKYAKNMKFPDTLKEIKSNQK
jgi:DNA-binding CsgD family transcriptional regulator